MYTEANQTCLDEESMVCLHGLFTFPGMPPMWLKFCVFKQPLDTRMCYRWRWYSRRSGSWSRWCISIFKYIAMTAMFCSRHICFRLHLVRIFICVHTLFFPDTNVFKPAECYDISNTHTYLPQHDWIDRSIAEGLRVDHEPFKKNFTLTWSLQ